MHCCYSNRRIGCACLAFGATSSSSLGSRAITIIFTTYQSMISTVSTALEYGISYLARNNVVGMCLVMVGCNDDRFVSFFGIDDKIDEHLHSRSIHN